MSGEEFFVNVDLNGSVEAAKAAVLAAQSYEEGTKLKLICGKYPVNGVVYYFCLWVVVLPFCCETTPCLFNTDDTVALLVFLPSHCFYFCKTARY